jgi:hypothetical protein
MSKSLSITAGVLCGLSAILCALYAANRLYGAHVNVPEGAVTGLMTPVLTVLCIVFITGPSRRSQKGFDILEAPPENPTDNNAPPD